MSDAARKTTIRDHHPRWVVLLAKAVMRLCRFRLEGSRPEVPKCVITAAPHTSNWDYFYTMLATFALDIPVAVLIKQEWFFWPVGVFMRWLGGVPVDRSKRTNLVDEMIRVFAERDSLYMVITPEGTRKRGQLWKSGYYWVAKEAGVSVLPAFIDYQRRACGFGPLTPASGDIEKDFEQIRDFYQQKVGVVFELRRKEGEGGAKP